MNGFWASIISSFNITASYRGTKLADSHFSNITSEAIKIENTPTTDPDFQGLKAILISSAHAIHDTYSGFIAPLIPFLILRLGLLKVEASFFIFLYQGVSILQPVIGHLADRINLRKFALLAPAMTAVFISLLGTAPTYQTALLFCFLAGFSSASMHAILPAQVGSLSGKQVGKGMSFWMVGGEIGIMLGPMIITIVIATSSIENVRWLMIGGILISLLLTFLLRDLPYHSANNGKKNNIPTRSLLAIMLPLGLILATRSLLRSSSELYLPLYLSESGASIWLAGMSLSILQGFGVLGVILGGFANDRYGYRFVMLISVIVSGLFLPAFVFSTGILQIISLAILGAASMMILPVGMAIVQEKFPLNRSLANGIYLAQFFAIGAIAGVVTGFLYDKLGGQQTFLLSSLIAFIGIPFIFLLPKPKKQSTIST